jgi:hypothetical protein
MEHDEVTRDVTRWSLKLTSPAPYFVRFDHCGRVDQWEKMNTQRPSPPGGRVTLIPKKELFGP